MNIGLPGQRKDPYGAFRFQVEIDNLIAGGFSEVTGLSVTTEVERKTFGGENDFEHVFVKCTKFSDITLKHGITDPDIFWEWYGKVINGNIERKNGSIYLLDNEGSRSLEWQFYDAFPIKWDGPSLNATTNAIAVESLVLAHHGLSRPKKV